MNDAGRAMSRFGEIPSRPMYDVVSIGSATQDVFLTADSFKIGRDAEFKNGQALRLPYGSKVEIKKIAFASGGAGTNAAVTAARQGFRTGVITVLGKDPNGTAILEEMRREHVDAKYAQVAEDGTTAYSMILVGHDGERTILSYKGQAHWNINAIPWDKLEAKWLYIDSLGGHLEILQAAVAWAQRTGGHIATNPGSQDLALGLHKLGPLWSHVDIVGMNQEEAAELTGIPYANSREIFKKMDELIGGIFIMTKGADGVELSDGKTHYSAGTPPSPVVERTGAGDAFHSGFMAEFIRSGNIEKAIQLATANSTSVVQQFGAKAGILKKDTMGPWPLVQVTKSAL